MSQAAKNIITIVLAVLLLVTVGFFFITLQDKEKVVREKNSLNQQVEDYKLKETKYQAEAKNLQDKMTGIEKERDALAEKIRNAGGDLDELSAKVKDLTKERDEIRQRMDVVQNERNELAQKLQEQSAVASAPKTESNAAAQTSSGMHSGDDEDYWAKILKDKAALQLELDKTKEDLSKTAVEVSELKKQNSDLEIEITNLNKQKEAINREIKYGNDLAKNLSIELARSQNEKQFMSDQMSKINDENNKLHQQLKNLTATKVALEKNIVNLQGDKKKVEGKLLETEGVISSRIDQIYQLKDSLEKEFKPSTKDPRTGEIQLSPIIVSNKDKGANEVKVAPAGQKGAIVSINDDNNFVIVNLGEDTGIKIGDKLNVYRGADYIAGLEVIQVRKDISAADIKNKVLKIEVGDTVR